MKNRRLVIYTAIIGKYDNLKDPIYIDEDCDYICFTDNKAIKSQVWEVKYVKIADGLDASRKSREFKMLPHKYLRHYCESMWIDATFQIIGSVREYINKYKKNSTMLCCIHPLRTCIYDEASVCINENKDKVEVIRQQMERYRLENYPKNLGLIAGGLIYRQHTDKKLIKVMESWWNELLNYSRRDQLSFNYVCWKNNFKYDISDIDYQQNKFFKIHKHIITDSYEIGINGNLKYFTSSLNNEWQEIYLSKVKKYISTSSIIIYSASQGGLNILNFLKTKNKHPKYFCDSNDKLKGKQINDITIISFEQFKALEIRELVIIIGSSSYYNEIYKKLNKIGIMDEKIIHPNFIYENIWD